VRYYPIDINGISIPDAAAYLPATLASEPFEIKSPITKHDHGKKSGTEFVRMLDKERQHP
jgi:hypothetical protein